MSPLLIRLMVYGAICAALVGFGALTMHRHDQAVLNALKSDFDAFRGGVDALGKAAQAKAQQETLANQQRKEQSDAQNAKVKSDLAGVYAAYASLRNSRKNAGSGTLPPVAPGSGDPSRACFDRASLDRGLEDADGLLQDGAAKILLRGDQAIVDLNSAREWAKKGP